MKPPEISIIIPSVAGSPTVRSLIYHLCHTNMGIPPEEYEIIVVVDGGEAFSYPAQLNGVSIRILSNRRYRGAPGARNTGALAARGKYLWFLDDDIFPSEGAIAVLMKLWRELGENAVLGITTNQLSYLPQYLKTLQRSVAGAFFVREYLQLFVRFSHAVQSEFVCSGSMAMSRDLFVNVGGFRELPPRVWNGIGIYLSQEDIELSYRLRKAGAMLYFVPEITFLACERDLLTASRMLKRAFIGGYAGRILWEETYGREGMPLPPVINSRLDTLLSTQIGWWLGRLSYFLHQIADLLYRLSGRRIYYHKFLLLARAAYAMRGRRFAESELRNGILSHRRYLSDES